MQAATTIKHLKKQIMMAQLPVWQQHVKTVGKAPFLYLELEDVSNDELRHIAESLAQHQPGFYVMIGKQSTEKRFSFVVYAHPSSGVDVKAFGAWLKTTFDLKGGGNPPVIQGGGVSVPENFKAHVEAWVASN